jgi:hypothetical protein
MGRRGHVSAPLAYYAVMHARGRASFAALLHRPAACLERSQRDCDGVRATGRFVFASSKQTEKQKQK